MSKSNSKKNNSNRSRNYSNRSKRNERKPKEVEVNVDRSDINSADMREAKKYMSKDNDGHWYVHNPALVADAANIPYSWPVGIEISLPENINGAEAIMDTFELRNMYDSIPGVFVAYWTPTIGLSENYTSAINIATQRLYAYTSYDISRTLRYDGPDLMNMILSMDNAYSFYLMMVRAYGTMSLYSSVNRYKPIALIEAMELDFNDLQTHLSEFRYFINQYAYKLSAINVPSDIDYIIRHAWMNTGIYLDSDLPEAQMYMYVQENYYQYVEVTDGPSYLQLIPWINGTKHTYEEIVTFANQLLYSILGSQDIGIMSGDILKTFGTGNLFTFGPIPDTYATIPVYSKEVLSQFENLSVAGPIYFPTATVTDPNPLYTPNIRQNVTGLTGGPAIVNKLWFNAVDQEMAGANTYMKLAGVIAASKSKMINMHIPDPTPLDNMVATRLSLIATEMNRVPVDETKTNYLYTFNQTGSEVVNRLRVYYNQYYQNGKPTLEYNEIHSPCILGDTVSMYAQDGTPVPYGLPDLVTLLSQFDWHPNIPFIVGRGGTQVNVKFNLYYPFMDTDNYAIISATDLQRMHDTALLSLFAVKKAWE